MSGKEHDCCENGGIFGFGFHPPPPHRGHHPPPPGGPRGHHPPPPFGFGANFTCGKHPFGPKFKDMGILNMLNSLFLDPEMAAWNPFIKIDETESEFKVKALVPGFEKDQIQLSVKGSDLLVEAKRENSEGEKTEESFMDALRFWDKPHMEYLIPLSEDIEPTKIKAKLSQGVLNITIERKKPANVNIE
jgi:HSP20 family protein